MRPQVASIHSNLYSRKLPERCNGECLCWASQRRLELLSDAVNVPLGVFGDIGCRAANRFWIIKDQEFTIHRQYVDHVYLNAATGKACAGQDSESWDLSMKEQLFALASLGILGAELPIGSSIKDWMTTTKQPESLLPECCYRMGLCWTNQGDRFLSLKRQSWFVHLRELWCSATYRL